MLLVILGIVFFIGLVMIHELGHFVAARKSGVTVEEYGLGFPPKVYGKKLGKHKTLYSINALPLGGFVKLKGEHDMDTGPGDFGAATLLQKLVIIAAGVFMNLVVALVLLAALAIFGMPRLFPDQYVTDNSRYVRDDLIVAFISDDTPAKSSDLREMDTITKVTAKNDCTQDCTVDFTKLGEPYDKEILFKETTQRFKGKTISVEYARKGESATRTTDITLRSQADIDEIDDYNKTVGDEQKKAGGYLGIAPLQYAVTKTPVLQAPETAMGVTQQLVTLTLDGLGAIVTGLSQGDTDKATENVSGPVGVFFILQSGSNLGFGYIIMIIAVISLTLALMNVLPIPALDGGRLFVILLFHGLSKLRQWLQGKPLLLRQKTEDWIHGTGFVLMMVLFVLITFVDIKRFF